MARLTRIEAVTFWHGGVPGLTPGTPLLPAAALGLSNSARGYASRGDHDHVFFTTDVELARAYAQTLLFGSRVGALYEVRPLDRVEPDPDYATHAPNICFMATRAIVLSVPEPQVTTMTDAAIGRAFGRYQWWSATEPVFGRDGTVNVGPRLREEGWTQEAFDMLPRWTRFDRLDEALSTLLVERCDEVLTAAPRLRSVSSMPRTARDLDRATLAQLASSRTTQSDEVGRSGRRTGDARWWQRLAHLVNRR